MEGFMVDQQTLLGLAMPNQCHNLSCFWGWFTFMIPMNITTVLHDYGNLKKANKLVYKEKVVILQSIVKK